MLLETRGAPVAKPDLELSDMGYDNIDGMNLPVTSILNAQGMIKYTIPNFFDTLTLKVPPIICSRGQFQILPLFSKITNEA